MPLPLYPWEKIPQYPLDRRLSGPQSQSEQYGEVKIPYPTRTQTPTRGLPAHITSRCTDYEGKIGLTLLEFFAVLTVSSVNWLNSVRILCSSYSLISMLCISQNKKVPGWSACVTWFLLLLTHRDCTEVVHCIMYIYTTSHTKPVSLSKSNSPTRLKAILVFFKKCILEIMYLSIIKGKLSP
jgi:hypothetical protein